jgi:hypothetical protein
MKILSSFCTKKLSAFLVLILASCADKGTFEVHACGEYLCTANGSIIKWNQNNVEFAFEAHVPQRVREAMESSSSDFNNVLKDNRLIIDQHNNRAPAYSGDPSMHNRDGINGIYYIKGKWPWEDSIKGSLAVTLTRFSANGIVEADVFIKEDINRAETYSTKDSTNQQYFNWVKYISAHELGHALGRSHSKDRSSLMYPSISFMPKITNHDPQTQDFFSNYDLELFSLAYSIFGL